MPPSPLRATLAAVAVLMSSLSSPRAGAAPLPKFTYEGRAFNAGGDQPLTGRVDLRVSIYAPNPSGDPADECLLYEETQRDVDLTPAEGRFSLTVGTAIASPRRTADDPGLAMADVLRNGEPVLGGSDARGRLRCPRPAGYVPAIDDTREMEIAVLSPSGARTLLRDTLILPPPTQADGVVRAQHGAISGERPEVQAVEPFPERRQLRLMVGLGVTSLHYTEAGKEPFSGLALSALTANLPLNSRLSVNANVAYGLANLSSNIPGFSLSYFDADAGVLWVTEPQDSPWSFTLGGGMYYSAALPRPEIMGFSKLLGPQLSVGAAYPVARNRFLGLQIRYSRMAEGFRIIQTSSHDLSAHLTLARVDSGPERRGGLAVRLSLAKLQTEIGGLEISALRASLSVGYGL